MPKRKEQETQEKQSERFRKEAQKLIDAGELSPIEANEVFEMTLKSSHIKLK